MMRYTQQKKMNYIFSLKLFKPSALRMKNQIVGNTYFFICFLLSFFIQAQSDEVYLSTQQIQDSLMAKGEYCFAAWQYSFIGEYRKALQAFDQTYGELSAVANQESVQYKKATFMPAAEYIIKRSSKERIIIINEAHHQPLHRVFT